MLGFINKIEYFKWNWQKKQKLTIEATMKPDELKQFLELNKIDIKEDISSISAVKLTIKVQ